MKIEFKKGDKVILINDKQLKNEFTNWSEKDKLRKGEVYIVSDVLFGGTGIELEGYKFTQYAEKFKLANTHPLIITKQTKARAGKKYFTWQMSKNKKVVNHQYNTSAGRNKQLAQFIEDIRNGNFEIK